MLLFLANVTNLYSFRKYYHWSITDTKETRLGLARAHIVLIFSNFIQGIIYLVSSIVIFDDFVVLIGDWVGYFLYAWLNYYFMTSCLRFGELKALSDQMLQETMAADDEAEEIILQE